MTLLDIGGGFPGCDGATLTVDKVSLFHLYIFD